MATEAMRFYAGTLTTTLTTELTSAVPANRIWIVKAVTLCNTTPNTVSVSIKFGGFDVINQYPISGTSYENTITIPFMDQVMNADEHITGGASANSAVICYISGKEVSVV